MLKNWKLRIASAALVAVSVTAGCFDFKADLAKCQESGPCKEEQGGPGDGGTDAGTDGGTDAGTDGGADAGCTFVSAVDLPDDDSLDLNCDGVDGVASTALFVDPATGNDAVGTPGSPSQPLSTLKEALARIRSGTAADKVAIFLAKGTYNEDGLTLDRPVSLYGGFGGRDDWFRKAGEVTHLHGGKVGLTVNGLRSAGVVLERMTISSANGSVAGEPSIALHVLGTSDMELRDAVLAAGRGGTGAEGAAGDAGIPGADGGVGNAANVDSAGGGGSGGGNVCPGWNTSGGSGQQGGGGGSGAPGEMGLALNGMDSTPGGDAGTGGTTSDLPLPSTTTTCNGGPGGPGGDGFSGDAGTPGPQGSGTGTLDNSMWVANQLGQAGTRGGPGAGGGGGGSGGGCPVYRTARGAAGGGSGGGGSGGCGGEGGKGGGGGGASIALLLIDSNVQLKDVQFQTLGGGTGGRGGAGGTGGTGGVGGTGGQGGFTSNATNNARIYSPVGGNGGNGGNGGQGGNGGPGGGGGGGPSVGIWCGPNAHFVPVTPLTEDGLGSGGNGGESPGGNPGAPGLKALTVGCPDAGTP